MRYTQALEHPRLAWATRRLELWKREPRARLTFRLNRRLVVRPGDLSASSSRCPCDGVAAAAELRRACRSRRSRDQLPGTCRDYFGIDGWAHYATPEGHWLWVSRDAPLVTLDGPHPLAAARPRRRRARAGCWRWSTTTSGTRTSSATAPA